MQVIEFCGNPGCGKTTISNTLISELQEKGFKAFDYNKIKPQRYIYNIKHILSAASIKNILQLLEFGKKAGAKKRIIYSVKCVAILDQLKKWERAGNVDVVVFDEGIIQYLSTLSHENVIEEDNLRLLKCLKELYRSNDYVVVNCQVELAENIKRIQRRDRSGDRFVSKETEKQKSLLCMKRKNLDILVKYLKPEKMIEINTKGNVEQLTNTIILHL